ncbi:MAG: formyltransferase family protein [Pseudomonadota bacterium]
MSEKLEKSSLVAGDRPRTRCASDPASGLASDPATRTIGLLCSEKETPFFQDFIAERDANARVLRITDGAALAKVVEETGGFVRLISFLSDFIVPSATLSKLRLTPYNIHPAPPRYPGAHPESFAVWEGAKTYGVTAHEMVAKVDAGAIVATTMFAIDGPRERLALADRAYAEAIKVFAVVAAHCAESDLPMARMDTRWGARKYYRRDFRALCLEPKGMSPIDRDRLKRACGPDFVPFEQQGQSDSRALA